MSKKLVSSILGAQAKATLQTSITATIIPIKVISLIAMPTLLVFMFALLSLKKRNYSQPSFTKPLVCRNFTVLPCS